MTSESTPSKKTRRKSTRPTTAGVPPAKPATPPAPDGTSTAEPAARAPTKAKAASQRGPNPNRLGLNRSMDGRETLRRGARLVDTSKVDLSAATRRSGGRPGARHTTITITSAPNPAHDGTFLIGLCIKDETGLRFDTYPSPGPIDDTLPLALENAVLRCPALRDLVVTTPYKLLWDERNHTKITRDYVRQHGCRITHAHPMPFDLGHMLARTAARGRSGPQLVDFHLYTASITDGERTYASGILYGRSKAYQFTQTFTGASLAAAEAAVTGWAFKLMPEHSEVMIHNANPTMREVWSNPDSMPGEVREVLKRVGQQLRLKNLKFKPAIEPYVGEIARVAREIVSHAYAGANLHSPRSQERP